MSDLVAFLRARLNEDEETAARGFSHPGRWVRVGPFGIPSGLSCSAVLRECSAKREIVIAYNDARAFHEAHPDADAGEVTGLYTALKWIATAYDWHPDYREEWRP